MMGGLAGAFGNVIEQNYQGTHRVNVTVTADSPMVQMFSMALSNPALMDKDSELIEYGTHKALLKTKGDRRELQILLFERHLVNVNAREIDEDALFALFDQRAIDSLAKALGQ